MTVEAVVGGLFALCVVGLIVEYRAEVRRAKEATEALRELMRIAERDDEEGRKVRMLLMAWATTPGGF